MTEPHLYHHGKPAGDHHEVHEHVSPVKAYVNVLMALLVLTGITYGVSYMDLGAASLTVAMIVALIKATLVCMYFMHLKYDERYHVFVFLSTVLFVAIFFSITIFDLTSRAELNEEQETFFQQTFDPNASVRPPQYEVKAHGEHAPGEHGDHGAPPPGDAPGTTPEAGPALHGDH